MKEMITIRCMNDGGKPYQVESVLAEVGDALAAKPLAQWLHGFFSSHAAPKPIKVETLHRLSGSEAGELKHFTQALKAALEALEKASAAAGQVFAWRIEGGVLHVTRTPSPSQKRHLERQEGSA